MGGLSGTNTGLPGGVTVNTLAIGLVDGWITGLRLILHVVVHWVTVVCDFVGGSVVVSAATAVVAHNNAVTKMIDSFIILTLLQSKYVQVLCPTPYKTRQLNPGVRTLALVFCRRIPAPSHSAVRSP